MALVVPSRTPRWRPRRPVASARTLLLTTTLLGSSLLAHPAHARPITRADVMRLAPQAAPARAARARAEASRSAVDRSGVLALDNPELSGAIGPRLDDTTTDLSVSAGLSVPVDVFGQRGSRIEAAEAEARAADADARNAVATPLRDALVLHAQALAARERRTIFVNRLRLLEELAGSTTRKREAGEIAENDVAVVRLQLARERGALANLEGDVAALEQQLAAVLMLPEAETAEATGPLVPEETPGPRSAPGPAVMAAEAQAEAARARLAREEAARRPTLRLLGAYELDQGAHIVTGGVAIPLPFYGLGGASVAAARGDAVASTIALEGARRRFAADRAATRLRIASTRQALDATRPASAEARGIVERAQRAYTAGEADLATLVVLRREALDAELARVDAELAHALAVVDAILLEGRWAR